jgi:hypothetical protein
MPPPLSATSASQGCTAANGQALVCAEALKFARFFDVVHLHGGLVGFMCVVWLYICRVDPSCLVVIFSDDLKKKSH